MQFVGWMIATAFVYFAVGRTLFVVADGVQRRKPGIALTAVLGCFVAQSATILWTAIARVDDYYHPPLPMILISVSLGTALWLWGQAFITDRKLVWREIKRRNELSRQIKLHLALVTGAIVFSVPFYWLITTSLKPDERVSMFPPDLIPMRQERAKIDGVERKVYVLHRDWREIRVAKMSENENDTWEVRPVTEPRETESLTVPTRDLRPALRPTAVWRNYTDALAFLPPEYRSGLKPLWNTVYVTLLTIVGTVLSSSLVAFSFARLRWPGRDLLFVVLLATMMIPPAVTMLPVFLIFRWLGWIDTLKPLWVPALFASAFNVFLLRQFFMTIPNELEDAAKIDGCSYFAIYWRIMLPLIKPALAAITIFAFMASWNNFMGPLIYISSPENMTLAYALQLFQGTHGGEPGMMMAAATLVMLPVLAVFFFTQRYMIQGVTLTGIKG